MIGWHLMALTAQIGYIMPTVAKEEVGEFI